MAKLVVSLDNVETIQQCPLCSLSYTNAIIHSLTSCRGSALARNRLWDFISNYCSVHLEAYLVSLSDEEFVCVMLGGPIPDDIVCNLNIHYLLLYRFLKYIESIKHVRNELILLI